MLNVHGIKGIFSTSTLWTRPSRAKTLGRPAQWKWYGRYGGELVHHRRPQRRTVSLMTSPDRLPLYWSWLGWLQQCPCHCARSCSHLCCSLDPRKTHFCPTSCRDPFPSCTSFCRPLRWKLSHSTLSPSSSDQSVPPRTTPVSRNQTFLGDLDMAAWSNVSLSCFPRTEKGLCVLCLDPGWVFWYLMKQISMIPVLLLNVESYDFSRTQRSGKCWLLTFLWTRLNPGFTTLLHTKT